LIEQWGLAGVALSAFLSATILPGNSEIALFAYSRQFPEHVMAALLLASLANTAGSITSYAAGRWFKPPESSRVSRWLQRWGCGTLLLAWLPLIGDGLCLAAGWLRFPFLLSVTLIFVGKCARYCAIVWFVM
jgi:membrane protein YqaA with SNARE-associated domain